MKKPGKKECICKLEYCECGYDYYNLAIDDYEKWLKEYLENKAKIWEKRLPSRNEITETLLHPPLDKNNRYLWRPLEFGDIDNIVKAIYKRIRG